MVRAMFDQDRGVSLVTSPIYDWMRDGPGVVDRHWRLGRGHSLIITDRYPRLRSDGLWEWVAGWRWLEPGEPQPLYVIPSVLDKLLRCVNNRVRDGFLRFGPPRRHDPIWASPAIAGRALAHAAWVWAGYAASLPTN